MKYTLDTDFSSLNGPKASNWILGFLDMIENAFADKGNDARLLGNLLILEPYVHTLRQGLEEGGRAVPAILQEALDLLWDYLDDRQKPTDFQDLANCLYAASLYYNVGEELTDAQEKFYKESLCDLGDSGCEWQILSWLSELLMELTAIGGGRLDFEEFKENCQNVSFFEMEEMINIVGDACIEFTGTPLPSQTAKDLLCAQEQVYQTPLFRQFIGLIQNGLKAAQDAVPAQYFALREDFRRQTLLPEKYAADLLEF